MSASKGLSKSKVEAVRCRLKSDFLFYCKCLYDLDFVALLRSEYFTVSHFTSHTRIGLCGNDRSVLYAKYTRIYEKYFCNRCVSSCNFLPTAVVNAGSMSCFKRLLSNVDFLTTHLHICNLGLPLTVCFHFLLLSMIAMFAVI